MNSSNFSPAELTKQRIKANNEAQKKANIAYYAQRVQYAKNFSPHKLNYYIALYNEALQLDKK